MGSISHCQNWRTKSALCWWSHCRRGVGHEFHTGIAGWWGRWGEGEKRAITHLCFLHFTQIKYCWVSRILWEEHANESFFHTNLWQAVHPSLTSVLHEVSEPLLPVVRLLLTEGLNQSSTLNRPWAQMYAIITGCFHSLFVLAAVRRAHQSDGSVVLSTSVSECDPVFLHVSKVFLCFFACTCSQTCNKKFIFL